MLLIRNTSHDPYYNQAFEEYVFQKFREGTILMLWRSTPAVVCGCFQNVFAEVDVNHALEQGVAVVRRITGGGTVYHDLGNWNYTIIGDASMEQIQYQRYLEPIVHALRRIGVPASMNRESDIAIDGKKISGSAQKIVKGRILHHGTLLYHCDLAALSSLANGQRDYFESKAVKSVPWPVTNMIDHMENRSLSPEQFGERLLASIAEEYSLEPLKLSEEELAEIEKLADEKYRTWEWNFGKNSAFSYRREFLYQGQKIRVEYQARKGVITEFSVWPENPKLSQALSGKRLSLDEISETLKAFPEWRELKQYIL